MFNLYKSIQLKQWKVYTCLQFVRAEDGPTEYAFDYSATDSFCNFWVYQYITILRVYPWVYQYANTLSVYLWVYQYANTLSVYLWV